jgi:hypothetical protein
LLPLSIQRGCQSNTGGCTRTESLETLNDTSKGLGSASLTGALVFLPDANRSVNDKFQTVTCAALTHRWRGKVLLSFIGQQESSFSFNVSGKQLKMKSVFSLLFSTFRSHSLIFRNPVATWFDF